MNNNIAFKRSQLPVNALFVGVDPHKKQHTISVCRTSGQVLSKFKIRNGRSGFLDLRQRVEQLRQRHDAATVIFAIEPGGHYWRTLAACALAGPGRH